MSEAPKTEMLDVSKLTGDGLEVTFIVDIGGQQKRYPLRTVSMRVGRSDQSDIAIKDPSVSSKHCDLEKEGGRLVVKDLGSSNGTFLNGARITESELNDGDVLRLGNTATLTVQITGAAPARRPQAAPPAREPVAGSTMMISANDLDAMRQPPAPQPPPRRAPAPMPMPMAPVPQQSSSKTGIIVGAAIAAVVVIGGIGALLFMKSQAKAKDREAIAELIQGASGLVATTPCAAVQDSINALTKLDTEVAAPQPPVKSGNRAQYDRYVDVQREKSRTYKRIVSSVEQIVTANQVTVDRIKADAAKVSDAALKAKAGEVAAAVDERMQLSQDFIGGWRRLETETSRYADLTEAVFLKGGGDQNAYASFNFSKKPPQVVGSCRSAHDSSKKSIEEKVAALKLTAGIP